MKFRANQKPSLSWFILINTWIQTRYITKYGNDIRQTFVFEKFETSFFFNLFYSSLTFFVSILSLKLKESPPSKFRKLNKDGEKRTKRDKDITSTLRQPTWSWIDKKWIPRSTFFIFALRFFYCTSEWLRVGFLTGFSC